MKIEPDKLIMTWGREGLNVKQDGWTIAIVNITDISLLGIEYGSDLDITPEGFFCTRKERIIKWLTEKKEE